MPQKILRNQKQIIQTYSRLVTLPYLDLPFDKYKTEILQLATELTYVVGASKAVHDIRKLDGIDIFSMAKLQGYTICKDTTFYLHTVHLSHLQYIVGSYGEYGVENQFYIQMQENWEEIPPGPHKQLMYQFHGVDGEFVTLDDQVDLDDGFSDNTTNPTSSEYNLDSGTTDSGRILGPEINIDDDEQSLWEHKAKQFDVNHSFIFDSVKQEVGTIWELKMVHPPYGDRIPSKIKVTETDANSESINGDHSNELTTKKSKTE